MENNQTTDSMPYTKRMDLLIFTTEEHMIIGKISNIRMHSTLQM